MSEQEATKYITLDGYQEDANKTNFVEDKIRARFNVIRSALDNASDNYNVDCDDALETLDEIEKQMNIAYFTLGMVGEAGEIAQKVSKVIRDGSGRLEKEHVDSLVDESGDVLWYMAGNLRAMGRSFSSAARSNLKKLFSRKDRGVLEGSGDKR